jgi:hypothetical protein
LPIYDAGKELLYATGLLRPALATCCLQPAKRGTAG